MREGVPVGASRIASAASAPRLHPQTTPHTAHREGQIAAHNLKKTYIKLNVVCSMQHGLVSHGLMKHTQIQMLAYRHP